MLFIHLVLLSNCVNSLTWLLSYLNLFNSYTLIPDINKFNYHSYAHPFVSQEGGVPLLTDLLEQCLKVQWGEQNQVVVNPTAPPVPTEASQRAMEALKILFNITHSTHTQDPSEVRATDTLF